MFNHRFIRYVLGSVLAKIAWLMLIPLCVAIFTNGNGLAEFFTSIVITYIVSFFLTRRKPSDIRLRGKDMLLLTTLIWLVSCAFGALPFILLEHFSFTDAYFETMSGLTTTGVSVLTNITEAAPSLLMWRSTLQWLGGLGFIVMAVAILPFLNVGGMKLFRTESSDKSDKLLPQAKDVAKSIIRTYVILTAVCCIAYYWAGMTFFDAINHAFTTLSTGGFSTRDGSMNDFSALIQWICLLFMFLGSLPFLLMVQSVQRRNIWVLFFDQQVRGFILFTLIVGAGLALWLHHNQIFDWHDSFRIAYFNLVNLMSTTGFGLGNFDAWTNTTTFIFAIAFFIGGCSGSTAGGIKIFRFQIIFAVVKHQILKLMHPQSVVSVQYNRQAVAIDSIFAIAGFLLCYFIILILGAVLVTLQGLDLETSLSIAATSIGNVGQGLGPIVGPNGSFANLSEPIKWLMVAMMLVGRLEIMTVLVLFFPGFWKK
ncbi:potassium transporter TrkH [Mergibacter septicus]|uniref:TrkH family potassium uptake protein n=1 Tax=Mergibacter septicus TaxID=221402 RepID=UPI001178E109|nr:TrkH family potassium uptake protein [Mergibacter septicus]AWX14187.1 potassium transporter TrkH [Mergibacter septicus]